MTDNTAILPILVVMGLLLIGWANLLGGGLTATEVVGGVAFSAAIGITALYAAEAEEP